jgi:glycosyltransferase involved in cell wall biosynthesis
MLSVVIPTTGRVLELERAIHSVLRQSLSVELEIIVVENNSGKSTFVKELCEKLDSVSWLYLPVCNNANVARNFGAKHSKGEYLAFLDSDDEWCQNYLEITLPHLKEVSCCISGFYRVSANINTKVIGHYSGSVYQDLIVNKSLDVRTSVMVFRRSDFMLIRFDENMYKHQDWALILDFSKKFNVAYQALPLVKIHVDGDGRMSANQNPSASIHFARSRLEHFAASNFLGARMIECLASQDWSSLVIFRKEISERYLTYLSVKYRLIYAVSIPGIRSLLSPLFAKYRKITLESET